MEGCSFTTSLVLNDGWDSLHWIIPATLRTICWLYQENDYALSSALSEVSVSCPEHRIEQFTFYKTVNSCCGAQNQEVMVKLISTRAMRQRQKIHYFIHIAHVRENRSIKQIISTDRPPCTSCRGSVKDTVCLTCFPVRPWWISLTEKNVLLSGREWAQWDEIRRRVQLSHTVHISERHCWGLLIWTVALLELGYHSAHWQAEERLFPLSFLIYL